MPICVTAMNLICGGGHLEEKASSTSRLHVADSVSGGYLIATETSDKINSVLRSTASIRSIANVIQIESATYEVLG